MLLNRSAFRVFLFLLLPGCLTAQETETWRSWNRPIEPFRIAGNLYYVGANEIASFLIATNAGHILIDGGFEETAPLIESGIRILGFELADVKILLNTHGHVDHAAGLARLKRNTGARLMVMRTEVPLFQAAPLAPDALERFPAVAIDDTLEDGQRVTLGGTVLQAHLTPGHTPGNTTWSMQVDHHGEILDVVFAGSPNVLPDVELVANKNYPNIAEDYRKTFAVLNRLPCDIFLGAHGSYFFLERKAAAMRENPAENPFIDPELYRGFVARKEKLFLERLHSQRSK